jgi:NADH-quinone oxidoreductase subunit H
MIHHALPHLQSVVGSGLLGAGDPLFDKGVDLAVVLIVIAKTLFTFVLLMVSVILLVWIERKVVADMQIRIGPDEAGPWGILQTLADGIKLFFKEQSIPETADRPVFRIAPYLAVLPAFLSFSVIPIGGPISIAGHRTYLQLANPPIGVLFILAMSGLGVYGVMLAGWASGSKYPLLSSVRASAQMVSYEAALGLSIVAAIIHAQTLTTRGIVDAQGVWHGARSILDWFWIATPVAFIIFFVAAVAETNRAPFDLVEAEQELVGGFHTEYTGIRFAIFFLSEYMNMITMSALCVTLFLGGPSGPHISILPALWPVVWFFAKIAIFIFIYIWLRASLPRLRYDQLMDLGWRYLIPIAVLWLGVTAVITVAGDEGWNRAIVTPAAAAGAIVVYAILYAAMPKREGISRG